MGWCSHCEDDVPFITDMDMGYVCCVLCGKIIDQDVNLTGPYFREDGSRQVVEAHVDDPGVIIQADPAVSEYSEESSAYEDINIGAIYDGDEYEDYSDGDGYEDSSDTDSGTDFDLS